MGIYIIFYKDKSYKTKEGIKVFTDYQKAKNYKNNAIRHIGRLLCKNEPWYDMGEERKQKYFDKAEILLEIRSFTETNTDVNENMQCWMCFNYNISNHYAEDLEICQKCKKYKYYKFK